MLLSLARRCSAIRSSWSFATSGRTIRDAPLASRTAVLTGASTLTPTPVVPAWSSFLSARAHPGPWATLAAPRGNRQRQGSAPPRTKVPRRSDLSLFDASPNQTTVEISEEPPFLVRGGHHEHPVTASRHTHARP